MRSPFPLPVEQRRSTSHPKATSEVTVSNCDSSTPTLGPCTHVRTFLFSGTRDVPEETVVGHLHGPPEQCRSGSFRTFRVEEGVGNDHTHPGQKKTSQTNRALTITEVSKDRTTRQGKDQETDHSRPKKSPRRKRKNKKRRADLGNRKDPTTRFGTYILWHYFSSLTWWYKRSRVQVSDRR